MARGRAVLGLVVGGFLVLSGFAHTFLGGAAMRMEMAQAKVPADLARALTVGWVFGGVCMFVLGAVVVWTFLRGLRGQAVALAPARLVGAGYLGFGVWAIAFSGGDPFFSVFLVPGALLLIASSPTRSAAH